MYTGLGGADEGGSHTGLVGAIRESCGSHDGRVGIGVGSRRLDLLAVRDGARVVVADDDLEVLGSLVVEVALVCVLAERRDDGNAVGGCHSSLHDAVMG